MKDEKNKKTVRAKDKRSMGAREPIDPSLPPSGCCPLVFRVYSGVYLPLEHLL